jgi:hypothetical protein
MRKTAFSPSPQLVGSDPVWTLDEQEWARHQNGEDRNAWLARNPSKLPLARHCRGAQRSGRLTEAFEPFIRMETELAKRKPMNSARRSNLEA